MSKIKNILNQVKPFTNVIQKMGHGIDQAGRFFGFFPVFSIPIGLLRINYTGLRIILSPVTHPAYDYIRVNCFNADKISLTQYNEEFVKDLGIGAQELFSIKLAIFLAKKAIECIKTKYTTEYSQEEISGDLDQFSQSQKKKTTSKVNNNIDNVETDPKIDNAETDLHNAETDPKIDNVKTDLHKAKSDLKIDIELHENHKSGISNFFLKTQIQEILENKELRKILLESEHGNKDLNMFRFPLECTVLFEKEDSIDDYINSLDKCDLNTDPTLNAAIHLFKMLNNDSN